MDAFSLIPSPDSIPVAWGWFEALLLGTFACHLLLVNALMGGVFFVLFSGKTVLALRRPLTKCFPTGVALAVNLGVPPLLFIQVLYGQFFYPSAVLTAVYWLSAVVLAMLAYALFYVQAGKAENPAASMLPLGVGAAALLLVSLVITNTISLLQHPEAWTEYFTNTSGTIINTGDSTFIPRWLHFLLASFAVGGLVAALFAQKTSRLAPSEAKAISALGCKWFTHASLLQVGIGSWWLMALPRDVVIRFMGGSGLATGVFVVALGAAALAIAAGFRQRAWAAAGFLAATMVLMVCLREIARLGTLGQRFQPEAFAVTGQYGAMIVFGVSLAFGLAAVTYMLRLYRRAGGGI